LNFVRNGVMKAKPLKLTLTPSDFAARGGSNAIYIIQEHNNPGSEIYTGPKDLKHVIEYIKLNETGDKVPTSSGSYMYNWPSKYVFLIHNHDSIIWGIDKQMLFQSDIAILDLIATNNWQRPIYFGATTSTDSYLGLGEYLQPEGYALRLVPYKTQSTDNTAI